MGRFQLAPTLWVPLGLWQIWVGPGRPVLDGASLADSRLCEGLCSPLGQELPWEQELGA